MACGARRTRSRGGQAPSFDQSVFLPFVPPRKDFSPNNLQQIRDNIYINLFDEVELDTTYEAQHKHDDAHLVRREKRWLGGLRGVEHGGQQQGNGKRCHYPGGLQQGFDGVSFRPLRLWHPGFPPVV